MSRSWLSSTRVVRMSTRPSASNLNDLDAVEAQLSVVGPRHSQRVPLLVQKVRLLADEFRCYEALDVLKDLKENGSKESMEMLEKTIEDTEKTMASFVANYGNSAPEIQRVVARQIPPLPEGVVAKEISPGQMGLFAGRDFSAEEVVFSETPLAVAVSQHSVGHACEECLRPLRPRRVVSIKDGSAVRTGMSGEQVEQMCRMGGLPPLELQIGVDRFCSDACRDHADKRAESEKEDDKKKKRKKIRLGDHDNNNNTALSDGYETSCILNKMTSQQQVAVLKCLLSSQFAFDEEPHPSQWSSSSSSREEEDFFLALSTSLWRAVRVNAVEVLTHPMALALDPAQGMTPVLDTAFSCSGSALYLVASLANHHCTDATLTPAFMDSVIDTPFIANRDIKAGEELTFDYASTVNDVRDKKTRNFLSHRFVCKC